MTAHTYLDVYLWANFFVALFFLRDICILRSAAFREAGHNKWLWLLLWLVSFVIWLSIPVLLWYLMRIRPSVASADSVHLQERRARKAVRWQQAIARQESCSAASRTSPGSTSPLSNKPAQPCGSCHGSGKQTCFACQGRGRHDSSTPSAYGVQAVQGWCAPCSGTGKTTCQMCSGTGKRN